MFNSAMDMHIDKSKFLLQLDYYY